ncbi:alpha/beta fold hydrolase [Peptostreptococcus faecalis]|uniref:alpha/beta fold hydrolase n=1 Tax=Peptostreptococcus faecalis TaxID=2045015 RepID=UPI000C7ABDD7|nr:alpha/beta hydrolase [Peptostreptococcus faecalis]
MWFKSNKGTVKIDNIEMDYVSFGKGNENLIMIPGLGESFSSVKRNSFLLTINYIDFARKYRVYIFNKKKNLPSSYNTKDMAKDQVKAMRYLGINKANILGISQGGMIAQYIAIDYPNYVNKLILSATISKPNYVLKKIISSWIYMAEKGDYKSIITDTIEKTYTGKKLKRYRKCYPIISIIGKPNNFNRFITEANACVSHDSYNEIDKIKSKTLIIGGRLDKIVGINASKEISDKINNSKLIIYDNLGHGVSEEAIDFNERVLDFLES